MKAVKLQAYRYSDHTLWMKRSTAENQLVNLLTITSTFIKGYRMRMSLRSSLKIKHELSAIDSELPAFYQQQLSGISCAEVVKDFCQLAKCATKSVVRIQLVASPSMLISQADWHSIISYCAACWNLSNYPAFALTSPEVSNSIDLFLLRETPLSWEVPKAEHQKLINQMMSLQVALVLSPPMYGQIHAHQLSLTDRSKPAQYAAFITWAIDSVLREQKAETIHQLADQLWTNCRIETDYQHRDHHFSNLRFRFDERYWLDSDELILGNDDMWVWLNFNRLFNNTTIHQRIVIDHSHKAIDQLCTCPLGV